MKRLNLILAALALISISCQDQKKDSETMDNSTSEVKYSENSSEYDSNETEEGEMQRKQTEDKSAPEGGTEEKSSKKEPIKGEVYMKAGEETDISCSCYCLDVNLNGSSELCLAKDEMYITARFESTQEGIDVYYVKPSAKNTNKELPWDKFEKNIPVASLVPTSDGLKLDWKGFSIDGELAVDYAIYGKKTLEGEYHIKK